MKVLVVDDHTLIREALRNVLVELETGCRVLEAADGAEAIRLAEREGDFDLVLLDLNLPDMDGFSALGALRRRFPATAVVVLSGVSDGGTVTTAIARGAAGYIPKATTHEVMVGALRLVCAGGVYLPPQAMAAPLGSASALRSGDAAITARASDPDLGLTEREAEVLTLLMQGKSNKVISRELGVAEATVKNHVTAVLRALDVTSRTQAVLAAVRKGWGNR